jgi:hypothetical protein
MKLMYSLYSSGALQTLATSTLAILIKDLALHKQGASRDEQLVISTH